MIPVIPYHVGWQYEAGLGKWALAVLVCSLGSGSSGNATLIRSSSGRAVLIDCGVSFPRLVRNLARVGCSPAALDAIVLSHEHSDHTQAAALLQASCGCTILAAPEMIALAPWLAPVITGTFPTDAPWTVGDLTIRPHAVAHDAEATYGFSVTVDGCTATLFTDLGHGDASVVAALTAADLIVLEANYDREMLAAGNYPWFLKRRISGRNGHLSNEDCAQLLVRACVPDRPRTIWLAHLSQNNNSPERAVETVTGTLAAAGVRHATVSALPRHTNGPVWEANRASQLPLFR
jgi:phosphoribosyl 1,2-cyclic phosphodiesterase